MHANVNLRTSVNNINHNVQETVNSSVIFNATTAAVTAYNGARWFTLVNPTAAACSGALFSLIDTCVHPILQKIPCMPANSARVLSYATAFFGSTAATNYLGFSLSLNDAAYIQAGTQAINAVMYFAAASTVAAVGAAAVFAVSRSSSRSR